ncbi:MAG TPA: hypothetical protein VMX13_03805 [Sedimentisphaerales bacterium]|nr:hypothetical protein [Sedimentisphaerales bacterium]
MVEKFVRTVANLGPHALIPAGIVAVLLGLFIWLGGLGFRKALAVIVGAVGGLLCALLFAGKHPSHLVLAAAAGIAVALIFEKIFLTLLAAALLGVAAIVAFAYFHDVGDTVSLRHTLSQLPPLAWIAAAGLAALCILAGFFIWRFVSALACSILGTMLVFAGMILLLTYKGAEPLKSIAGRAPLYAAVFGVMVAFGAAVQLLLCPRCKKIKMTKIEPKKQDPQPTPEPEAEQKRLNWRMH